MGSSEGIGRDDQVWENKDGCNGFAVWNLDQDEPRYNICDFHDDKGIARVISSMDKVTEDGNEAGKRFRTDRQKKQDIHILSLQTALTYTHTV